MRLLVLALALSLGACALPGERRRAEAEARDPARVAAELQLAERAFASGDFEAAVELLLPLRAVREIDPTQRSRAELLLERATSKWIEVRSAPHRDPEDLEQIWEYERPRGNRLPARLRVRAAILAAREHLERGSRDDAWRLARTVGDEYPRHHLWHEAGDVIAQAGFALANDDGRHILFFRQRNRAVAPLDYLVLHHPSHPKSDLAFYELGRIFYEQERWQAAIDRHEELLLNHPSSPLVPDSQLAVPLIRMQRLRDDQHERGELVRAERELLAWLERHAGGPRTEEARAALARARQRLFESDFAIARFYRRIEKPTGARIHGVRALEVARDAGAEARAAAARELLDELPAREAPVPLAAGEGGSGGGEASP